MEEREMEGESYWHHKTPSLSHWSSFIHWLTGLGTSSLDQSETRGFREVVTVPEKTVQCFHFATDWSFWQMCAEIFLIFFLFIHSRLTDNVCRFSALLLQLGAARSHAPLQLHYCSFKCFAPAHFQQTEHLLFRCRNSTHFSNLVTIHNLYLKRHYSCFSFLFFFLQY